MALFEVEERNAERATVDEVPYRIRGQFALRLRVPFDTNIGKSRKDQDQPRINEKVHSLDVQAPNFTKASQKLRKKENRKSFMECANIKHSTTILWRWPAATETTVKLKSLTTTQA